MTHHTCADIRIIPLIVVVMFIMSVTTAMPAYAQEATTVEIHAMGLINPKGLAFTSDGTLYVSEAGAPGDVMVPLPVNFGGEGPIGTNGRVSRVTPDGVRHDHVTGLPNIGLYGGVEMLGSTGVAVINDVLYHVPAGHMTVSPMLSRIEADGTTTPISDVGAFNDDNPTPPSNGDAVPMGNPYDLVALGGDLYITDGNYNRVIKATLDGGLSLFAQWEFSPVTVGAGAGPDGNLYVAQFSPAPYNAGSGRVDMITPGGEITEGVVTGLTTPIDVAFAPDGTMYVLQYAAEFSADQLRYVGYGGEVQRVNADGTVTPVVIGLMFPTAMVFGPDGALYVSNYGNESNDGQGQILRVVPGATTAAAPHVEPPDESGTYTNVQPTPTPIAGAEAPVVTIEIIEPTDAMAWTFEPNVVTIQVGQTVEFVNGGRIVHTATARNGAFDTGNMRGGESVIIQINEPGTYEYICTPHPWMVGTIIVEGEGSGTDAGAGAVLDSGNDPPTIGFLRAFGFVAILIAIVFLAATLMNRSSRRGEVEPEAPTDAD
ncbi:MAG TPA: ScyD/ScyE family protein [Thermomicrobiales bacterium]|nr:ScyD/ScyE family protein [Thermomicrobiales bacterium]